MCVCRILTIVHLVFFIRASILETNPAAQAELGQVKVEAQPQAAYPVQPQAYPAQAPQPYPVQQPYPPQQGPYPPQ